MKGTILELNRDQAVNFLLPRHYSGRAPSISLAYGLMSEDRLVAVCTFGKPSSPQLCTGICGEEHSKNVYELNRLCRIDEWTEPLSAFVSACLRRIRNTRNWIIVSYSDTAMHHNGYIYQATNFIYTGKTKERTDKYAGKGAHSRHYDKAHVETQRQTRSSKHRYVYFATRNKALKNEWAQCLKYSIHPYPKEPNKNYVLGQTIKQNIIRIADHDSVDTLSLF